MSVYTILTVFAKSYTEFFIWQNQSSFGLGCATPVTASVFSDEYSSEKRGQAFGKLSIITTVIGLISGAIIFINIAEINWRLPYLVIVVDLTRFWKLSNQFWDDYVFSGIFNCKNNIMQLIHQSNVTDK